MNTFYSTLKDLSYTKEWEDMPFELIESEDEQELDTYFFQDASKNLFPFGRHKSGSFICFWNKSQKPVGENNEPIVWIDSEAEPIALLASNLKDFLSIIPYGIEFLYEIMAAWKRHNTNPQKFALPSLSSELIEKEEALKKEILTTEPSYFNILKTKIGISLSHSPILMIEKVNNENIQFHEWINKGLSIQD